MIRYQEEESPKVYIKFDTESDFNLFRVFMRNHGYMSNWTPSDSIGFGADIDSIVFRNIGDLLGKYKIKFT